VRGDEQRAAIRTVLGAFGHDSRPFVFIGGCVLGLYARPDGAPLRATNDVDCISTLSPHGLNVGGVNPWFERAARHAREYDVGEGRTVNAVTPPYFLATKLVAFENRGPDASSSKDAEDIVTLIVETADIVEQVELAQIRSQPWLTARLPPPAAPAPSTTRPHCAARSPPATRADRHALQRRVRRQPDPRQQRRRRPRPHWLRPPPPQHRRRREHHGHHARRERQVTVCTVPTASAEPAIPSARSHRLAWPIQAGRLSLGSLMGAQGETSWSAGGEYPALSVAARGRGVRRG